jgi:hypothetical protein
MTRRVFYPGGAAGNPFYQLNGYKITPVVVNWAVIVVIVELKILLQHYFGTGNIATTATVIGNYYPCSCGTTQCVVVCGVKLRMFSVFRLGSH